MKEQTLVEEDVRQMGDTEAPHGGKFAPEGERVARCVCCGEGMDREVLPRFSRGYGILVLIVGILLAMFVSLLLGVPMAVIGAYMGAANRNVWVCRACGTVVDRIGT
jgi:hypothetical protein